MGGGRRVDEVGQDRAPLEHAGLAGRADPLDPAVAFVNTFFDTGEIKSTGRPSWWRAEWGGESYQTPDPGRRCGGAGADADTELAVGGPLLVENGGRSTNAGMSEADPELPDSQSNGNFGKVDTQPLPGLVPMAGQTTFEYDDEMRLTATVDGGRRRSIGYDPAGRVISKRWPFKDGEEAIGHTFGYDPNGNLRRIVNPKGLSGGEPEHVDSGSNAEADLLQPTRHATVRTYNEDDLLTDVYLPWGERDDLDRRRFKHSFVRGTRGNVRSIVSPHRLEAGNAPRTSYGHFDTDWVSYASDEDMMDPATNERHRPGVQPVPL